MKRFKNRYRIVSDEFAGYEVQIKRWWLPGWWQCDFINTHESMDTAAEYAKRHAARRGGKDVIAIID